MLQESIHPSTMTGSPTRFIDVDFAVVKNYVNDMCDAIAPYAVDPFLQKLMNELDRRRMVLYLTDSPTKEAKANVALIVSYISLIADTLASRMGTLTLYVPMTQRLLLAFSGGKPLPEAFPSRPPDIVRQAAIAFRKLQRKKTVH